MKYENAGDKVSALCLFVHYYFRLTDLFSELAAR